MASCIGDLSHITDELTYWLSVQDNPHEYAGERSELGLDARFEFVEQLTATTCDPRLDKLPPLAPRLSAGQITFRKVRTSRGIRITPSLDGDKTTLASCLDFLFGPQRLEGKKAYDIGALVPEWHTMVHAQQVKACVPDLKVVAEQQRQFKALPHTFYIYVDMELGSYQEDEELPVQPLSYPSRIDFNYPPYSRFLTGDAVPQAYSLCGIMAMATGEDPDVHFCAFFRDPADGQWYAAKTGDQMRDFRVAAKRISTEEAMGHAGMRDADDPFQSNAFYYVRDEPCSGAGAAAVKKAASAKAKKVATAEANQAMHAFFEQQNAAQKEEQAAREKKAATKPTKKERASMERHREKMMRSAMDKCKEEREQQLEAAETAKAVKLAAEGAAREAEKQRADAARIEAEALAAEEAEAAKQAEEEAEPERQRQAALAQHAREAAHVAQREAQQKKRDPRATPLQLQLAEAEKQADLNAKEAERVEELAKAQQQQQVANDETYANEVEAKRVAKGAQVAAKKAAAKARKAAAVAGRVAAQAL